MTKLIGTNLRRALWLAEYHLKIGVIDFRNSVANVEHELKGNVFSFSVGRKNYQIIFSSDEKVFIEGPIPMEEDLGKIMREAARRQGHDYFELSCFGVPRTFPFKVRETEWESVYGRPWPSYQDEKD